MRPAVFILFFLSGFSALVYEVAWVRELSLILGNTAHATATVLAVFLGGLALGAYIAGKKAKSLKLSPLGLYALLEFAVGLTALIVSQLLQVAGSPYIWLYQHLPFGAFGIELARLLIAGSILVLPTMLMGATLPVLVCYLEQHMQSAKMFSVLYGVNTLGAAAGSVFACFIGFAYLGLAQTLLLASGINLAIGSLALCLRKSALSASSSAGAQSHEFDLREQENKSDFSVKTLCTIAFLAGFTALSYEVLWTRILRCYVASMSYSFTIMVSMFLLGLAAGSFIYERHVLKTGAAGTRPFLDFGIMQYLATMACAASLPLFPLSAQFLLLELKQVLVPLFPALSNNAVLYFVFLFLLTVPTILLPAIFIGVLFPMLGTLAASLNRKQALDAVARVYAFNTLGCVCGSLFCGFYLVPTLGSLLGFQWTVLISVFTGSICVGISKGISRIKRISLVVIPLLCSVVFLNLHFQNLAPCEKGSFVLVSGEDTAVGVMRVIAYPALDGVALELNGLSMANSFPGGRRYMRTLACLPLLLHKNPENVLLGCFGTGTTAGVLPLYGAVKKVDIVELSQMVINAAAYFQKTNYNVLKNSKVAVHINDVRNFLLTTEQKYDVITFEPPPPHFAGTVSLYSTEFYELAKKHLNDDGLLCQWVPLNQVSKKLWKMMLASARSVFPYVSLWSPNNKEVIFIASNQAFDDLSLIEKRVNTSPEAFKECISDVGLPDAKAIIATYLCSGKELDEYIKDSPAITDNNPRLEFFLPFLGPTVNELELESPSGIEHLSIAGKTLDAEEEQVRNSLAIHILRQLYNTPGICQDQADRMIDQAGDLVPNNQWLRYIKMHRQVAYPRNDPTVMN